MKYLFDVCEILFQANCVFDQIEKVQSIEILKNSGLKPSVDLPHTIILLKEALEKTLKGGKVSFLEKNLVLDSLTTKQINVLRALQKVPRGSVISYSELGMKAGLGELAARFVGNVMAKNPFPVLYPCHRVLNKNGFIGNYSGGGPEIKKKLLLMEGFDKFKI